MKKTKILPIILANVLLATALCSCSTNSQTGAQNEQKETQTKELKVLAYDSFNLDKKLMKDFEKNSGYKIKLISSGGGGELVNKLILTKNAPVGDVVFGLDNAFAGRALKEKVLEKPDLKLPDGAEKYTQKDAPELIPIDHGQVCVNADKKWFDDKKMQTPETFEDLAKPEYKNLFAGINPTTSSAGLGFFLSSVAHFGENNWQQYWTDLKNNGMKISKDWSGAYNVDFTAGEGKGDKPLVVSYATSPLETLKDGKTSTVALPKTCYDQIEYAGIIKSTKNKKIAQKFIEYMLSKKVQDTLLDKMYVFPVSNEAKIDDKVMKFTPPVKDALTLDTITLEKNRDNWLKEVTGILTK